MWSLKTIPIYYLFSYTLNIHKCTELMFFRSQEAMKMIWIIKKPIAIISDIDECSDLSLNDCPPSTSFCRNAYGNYSCECVTGFQMRNGACEGRVNYICYLGFFQAYLISFLFKCLSVFTKSVPTNVFSIL